jgi:hypothetical protein
VHLLNYVFKGDRAPLCPTNRGDLNSDGTINIGDIVVILNYLFKGTSVPDCPGIW